MIVKVSGIRDDQEVTLEMGGDLPGDLRVAFDIAIEDGRRVGVQWWREVPSYTEAAGFVAGCLWYLDETTNVEGFIVPAPDPALIY